VPLTPGQIMVAARAGMVATVAYGISGIAMETGPIGFGALGYCGTLAGFLAFPRIRRDDILIASTGGVTLAAGAAAFGTGHFDVISWAAAIVGIALTVVPLVAARVRRLAASNPHMPFAEWRVLERRQGRRSTDRPLVIDARVSRAEPTV
jgi:hypothetical protein